MNADPAPVGHLIRDGSEFLRTKYYGELAVREEFPEAIIFRPSRMFGFKDYLLNFYYQRKNFLYKKMPLWNKGYGIYKQPVFNADVSQGKVLIASLKLSIKIWFLYFISGVINAIYDNEVVGKTVDAVGPRRYELNELVKFLMRATARGEKNDYFISELRTSLSYLLRTKFSEATFKYPLRTMEMLEMVNKFFILFSLLFDLIFYFKIK